MADDAKEIKDELHALDKALTKLATYQQITTKNVNELSESVDKLIEVMPEIASVTASSKSSHKRIDSIEVKIRGLNVLTADVALLKKIVFSFIGLILVGFTSAVIALTFK